MSEQRIAEIEQRWQSDYSKWVDVYKRLGVALDDTEWLLDYIAALPGEGEEANPLRPVPGFAMPPVEVQEQIKAHREPQAEQEKE